MTKFITQKIILGQCCFLRVRLASESFSTVESRFSMIWPELLYKMSFFCSW